MILSICELFFFFQTFINELAFENGMLTIAGENVRCAMDHQCITNYDELINTPACYI